MSLRTKMMLIIFVFQLLVFGFLTVLFALEETGRARREIDRDAELLIGLIQDWAVPPPVVSDPEVNWNEFNQRLLQSRLVARWVVVARRGGRLVPMASDASGSLQGTWEDADRFQQVFEKRQVIAHLRNIYVPFWGRSQELFVARLEPQAAASTLYGASLGGLVLAMTVGTVSLLLITYFYVNRSVLRPLTAMIEGAQRVAGGDFSRKVPETIAYDELATLVRTFNQMMDRMSHYQQQLQNEVRQAQQKIVQTERRLFHAQRLSTTGTLAAGLAHEINNPLGGMTNAARAIREGKLDPGRQKEYLDLILDGLDRVRAIVQQVLQFRPKPFEPQPVALREVVEKAAAFLDHRAKHKGVEVRNEVPAGLAPVNGDPLELQQAVLNVLMNAVDACGSNEGMITVYAKTDADAVRLSIADNGCGMGGAALARCMDPFFTTKEVGEGTGLGLSVANNIIENHGGKIDIQSAEGRGTTVSFILPAAKTLRPIPPGGGSNK